MNKINSFLEKIINYRKRPINILMLSPEDYAGSGCRIRDAVRKVAKKDKISIHLVTLKKRNISFSDADIVLSDGRESLKKAQLLLDKADIVHFKDDNPPVDEMYGLILPPNAKIVHTAGGSGFRRVSRSLITEKNISRKIKLPLKNIGDSQLIWKMNHMEKTLVWASGDNELELNLMNYIGKKHAIFRSCSVKDTKGPIVIRGDVILHQTEDNAGFKIYTIITEHLDNKGTVTEKTIRKFGAIRGKKLPWHVVIYPKKEQSAMQFVISVMFTDKSHFNLSNIEFLEMKNNWNKKPISEEIEQASMGLWPLETYKCADLQTVLTADLLIDDNIIFTPQAIPTSKFELVNKSNKRLIVTHAPSNRMKKGTDSIILPALKRLSEKIDFEIKVIEGVTHEECLEQIQKSDLYVELGLGGFYGNAAMEAMAFGVPIAVHLKESVTDLAGDVFEDCPIIPVRERTIEALTDAIEPWLENPTALRLQGLKSKKWVSLFHDEKIVGKKWLHLYRNLFNPISRFYQLFRKKKGKYYLPRIRNK